MHIYIIIIIIIIYIHIYTHICMYIVCVSVYTYIYTCTQHTQTYVYSYTHTTPDADTQVRDTQRRTQRQKDRKDTPTLSHTHTHITDRTAYTKSLNTSFCATSRPPAPLCTPLPAAARAFCLACQGGQLRRILFVFYKSFFSNLTRISIQVSLTHNSIQISQINSN